MFEDAVGGEFVMPVLDDPRFRRTCDDPGGVTRSESLALPVDGGEDFLGNDKGVVNEVEIGEADVARGLSIGVE
ncbi:MAG: hypothetical protein DWQ29_21905, partial [Planctomycetota bacterium]